VSIAAAGARVGHPQFDYECEADEALPINAIQTPSAQSDMPNPVEILRG